MNRQVSTKTGKFAVGYFPLDVKRIHLTQTVCYDLGNNKKKILNIPYTNYFKYVQYLQTCQREIIIVKKNKKTICLFYITMTHKIGAFWICYTFAIRYRYFITYRSMHFILQLSSHRPYSL
jgi:hypothetical protein